MSNGQIIYEDPNDGLKIVSNTGGGSEGFNVHVRHESFYINIGVLEKLSSQGVDSREFRETLDGLGSHVGGLLRRNGISYLAFHAHVLKMDNGSLRKRVEELKRDNEYLLRHAEVVAK